MIDYTDFYSSLSVGLTLVSRVLTLNSLGWLKHPEISFNVTCYTLMRSSAHQITHQSSNRYLQASSAKLCRERVKLTGDLLVVVLCLVIRSIRVSMGFGSVNRKCMCLA